MKFVWGATFTDHMLICQHDPEIGWLDPEIKPYGPLQLDPASTCLHYAPAYVMGSVRKRMVDRLDLIKWSSCLVCSRE
jgi:hypothetical protein